MSCVDDAIFSFASEMDTALWRSVDLVGLRALSFVDDELPPLSSVGRYFEHHLDIVPSAMLIPSRNRVGSEAHELCLPLKIGMVIVEEKQSLKAPNLATPTFQRSCFVSRTRREGIAFSSIAVCFVKEMLPNVAPALIAHTTGPYNCDSSPSSSVELFHLASLVLLCVSPMSYSVWNGRKKRLIRRENCTKLLSGVDPSGTDRSYLELLCFELHFTTLVLSKFPKIQEVLVHRLWVQEAILSHLMGRGVGERGNAQRSMLRALSFLLLDPSCLQCLFRAADAHHRNYPLWFSLVTGTVRCAIRMLETASPSRTADVSSEVSSLEASTAEATHLNMSSVRILFSDIVASFVEEVVRYYLPLHANDHTAAQCAWGLLGLVESMVGRVGSYCGDDGVQNEVQGSSPIMCHRSPRESVFVLLLTLNTRVIIQETRQYAMRLHRPRNAAGRGAAEKDITPTAAVDSKRGKKRACAHSDEGNGSLLSGIAGDDGGEKALSILPVTEGSWQVRTMLMSWYLCEWGRSCPRESSILRLSIPQMEWIREELAFAEAFIPSSPFVTTHEDAADAVFGLLPPFPISQYALAYGATLLKLLS